MVTDTVHWRTAKAMVGWSSLLMNSWCHGWLKQSTGEQLRPWLAEAVYWWIAKAMIGVCSLLANSWGDGSLMQSTCEQRRLCLLIQSTGEHLMPWLGDAAYSRTKEVLFGWWVCWWTAEATVGVCILLANSWGDGSLMQSTCWHRRPCLGDAVYWRRLESLIGWFSLRANWKSPVWLMSLLVNSWCHGWRMQSTGGQSMPWLADVEGKHTAQALFDPMHRLTDAVY